ncbi:MAG: pantoate--beta-alanine ligase [Gammaproteobacteria bacterium]|nr:pantoate--beta-alanine ligase [Gammaproteobacteria bacterium]
MIIVKNCQQLQNARSEIQGTVALVTTMGNLHQGHLSLVEKAKQEADNVIVTIFVNPLQFSANEDLDSYPRTLTDDIEKLETLGVDLLFTPTNDDIYPEGMNSHTHVIVPSISYLYCGANRKRHFLGVTTIVCKLFNLTRPNVAIFGKKDFQQLTIIQKMVTDLAMPIKIIGMPTFRESSGLAMSSRNRYLSSEEKQQAATLYETLKWAEQQLKSGHSNYREIESIAITKLKERHFNVEYFNICQHTTLSPATDGDKKLVILCASKFRKPRLIDNIIVDLTPSL